MFTSRIQCRLCKMFRHRNEAKSTRVARLAFRRDVTFEDRALAVDFNEEIIQLIGKGFVGEVTDVQFDGGGAGL